MKAPYGISIKGTDKISFCDTITIEKPESKNISTRSKYKPKGRPRKK